ncbi:unnamed protein product [Euphydryas editha]|uniref:DUF4817 domain-containing protein n=1 Tax=Euphydryas editha TaxID=104508 RepID=A0AAU9UVC9_EUPED|nr:unnamed protein product [Euphydryas editha]
MNRLTPEQRFQIVQIYFENHGSVRNTYHALRPFYECDSQEWRVKACKGIQRVTVVSHGRGEDWIRWASIKSCDTILQFSSSLWEGLVT